MLVKDGCSGYPKCIQSTNDRSHDLIASERVNVPWFSFKHYVENPAKVLNYRQVPVSERMISFK